MFNQIRFTTVHSGHILATVIFHSIIAKYPNGLNSDEIMQMLTTLALKDYPIGHSDSYSDSDYSVLYLAFPLSLAEFFIDKFEKDARFDVRPLKKYLERKKDERIKYPQDL